MNNKEEGLGLGKITMFAVGATLASGVFVPVKAARFLGKQKAGSAPGRCMNIQFSTRFWSNFIRILAAWTLVAVPSGSKVPSSWPLMSWLPLAQLMAASAQSAMELASGNVERSPSALKS